MTVDTSVSRIRSAVGEKAKSLATYLAEISDNPDECRTVSSTINPLGFEATSVLELLQQRGEYPAVIFENPLNAHGDVSEFPLVMNMWASRERCADAVGIPRSDSGPLLGTKFAEIVKKPIEPTVISSVDAPVHAHIYQGDDIDMWKLPIVRHSEGDLRCGALTMALAMKAPDEDFYNITFVKLFPEAGNRGGVTIHSKDMARMLRLWGDRKERIPCVFILGHHPAFWLGTVNATPYGDNEYATAGGFLGESVRLAPSVTWGDKFLVPADAEIVIEGEISADELTLVDPFGEISGNYQPQAPAPLLEVTAITHRDGAIMQDIFSGHREHMLLGSIAREGAVYNHLKERMGVVTAVHFPYSGCGRFSAYISINKTNEAHAKQAAVLAIGFTNVFVVVVVDAGIDVFNEEEVVWALNTYVSPERDVDIVRYLQPPNDTQALDASRVLIDATRPTHIPFAPRLRVPKAVMDTLDLDSLLDPPRRK